MTVSNLQTALAVLCSLAFGGCSMLINQQGIKFTPLVVENLHADSLRNIGSGCLTNPGFAEVHLRVSQSLQTGEVSSNVQGRYVPPC